MSKVNEIREELLKGNVIFTINNNNVYDRDDEGNWGFNRLRKVCINNDATMIYDLEDEHHTNQMNINEVTNTSIKLFTYNFLGTRVASTIKLRDITIVGKKESLV